jgi:hypothetical protein
MEQVTGGDGGQLEENAESPLGLAGAVMHAGTHDFKPTMRSIATDTE